MLAFIGWVSFFVFQTGLLAILGWLVGWLAGFVFSAHMVWLFELAALTMGPASVLVVLLDGHWRDRKRARARERKREERDKSEERRRRDGREERLKRAWQKIERRYTERLNQLSQQLDKMRQDMTPNIGRSIEQGLDRFKLIRYVGGDDPELTELLCGVGYPRLGIPATELRNQVAAIERSISPVAKPPEGEERSFLDEIAGLPDVVSYGDVCGLWDRLCDAIRRERKFEQELEAVEVDDDTGPPYYNEVLRRLYRIKNALRIALISRSQHLGLLEVS